MGFKKQFFGLFPGNKQKKKDELGNIRPPSSDRNKKGDFNKKELFPNWDNTKPFIPSVYYGKVIKCYDVDTITIVAKPYKAHPIFRFSVRLSGIDGPEIRTKNENEKKAAQISKKYLTDKILNQYIHLEVLYSLLILTFFVQQD